MDANGTDFFLKAAQSLPIARERLLEWMEHVKDLAASAPDLAMVVIEKTPSAIDIFGENRLGNWLQLAAEAAKNGLDGPVMAYLEESSNRSRYLPLNRWEAVLKHAAAIAEISVQGATAFVRYGYRACSGLDDEGIASWISKGAAMELDDTSLFNYFLGGSAISHEIITALLPRMRLEESLHILSLVCKALVGREVTIKSMRPLMGQGDFPAGRPRTAKPYFYLKEPRILKPTR